MWDSCVKIQISLMKKNIICAYLSDFENNFWISCVYGHPVLQHKKEVWEDLNSFACSIDPNDEWVTLGVFNQAFNIKDKLAFKNCTLIGSDHFIECINECNLSEIPLKGQFMTWTNNREGEEVIWERLDKAFANT